LTLSTESLKLVDRAEAEWWGRSGLRGIAWSPCGRWLAYSFAPNERTHIIKIYDAETGAIHAVTQPEFRDVSPAWDPDGEMLYFLSYRDYDPVPDNLQYELAFPMGMRVMAVVLRKDIPNPLLPQPRPFEEKPKEEGKQESGEKKTTAIDFDDIHLRVITVPLPAGIYGQVAGLSKRRVLATQFPVEGTLGKDWLDEDGEGKGTLLMYDFINAKTETLASKVNDFVLSLDGKTLAYRSGKRLRVLPAGQKPDEKHESAPPSRESGWIDLSRVRCAVVPTREWQQMYREAWRLQREFFWSADMSGVDWQRVYDRYYPLLERVATRGEFSDLMWEMQGELGTSHCYEFGGDYRQPPQYSVGLLGAEFEWDEAAQGYRIVRILTGDPWLDDADSPLNEPGVNAKVGEVLLAINGRRLTRTFTPGEALLHQAGAVVQLTLRSPRRTDAHRDHQNAERRIETALPRLGEPQPRLCSREDQRASRLHPHPRYGQHGLLGVPPRISCPSWCVRG
jgi:tricorn protease